MARAKQSDSILSRLDWTYDESSGCWPWTRGKNCGYGIVWFDGAHHKAHRVVFEMANGPIPAGMHLHHKCENRSCVNPEHVMLVTRAEHTRYSPQVKLSEADVAEIRRIGSSVSQRALARRFGCDQTRISQVLRAGMSVGERMPRDKATGHFASASRRETA
jgi:hypothetical protein